MELIKIVGWVEAIYFENPNNLYKVMRISVDGDLTEDYQGHEIVVTGQFTSVDSDSPYEFSGELIVHPKYGEQLQVSHYQQVTPSSREGLIEYLSSYRFKGVGTVMATRIVDELGLDAIEKIFQNPHVLDDIPGLVNKTRDALIEALQEHKGTEKVYIQLTEWGFTRLQSEKIYGQFGHQTISKIKENPYVMCMEIEGISFARADNLAQMLEIPANHRDRITAALYTVVRDHCFQEGNTYLEIRPAMHACRDLLESTQTMLIDNDDLLEALKYAIEDQVVIHHHHGLMIPSLYFAEISIANCLRDLVKHSDVNAFSPDEIGKAFAHVEDQVGIEYDAMQKEALLTAMNSPISIITGGPGTGKTTLIKGLIYLHAYLNEIDISRIGNNTFTSSILLAAPTGRAAKRMADTTGLPAATIHRLIGYTVDTKVDQETLNDLEGSLLIVDEMSMVDTWLMNWLVKAIPYNMQVVFVGDRDQLPSVGPGQVFADLIDSECLPTVSLKKIYRQANDSSIIQLAHQVKDGRLPDDFLAKLHDRTFIECRSHQIQEVVHQVVQAADKKGFTSNNLQVLAPMYKGPAGINNMNTMLQDLLNPAQVKRREISHYETVFRVGDKVIQLINNTDEGIFNGDIGHITGIFTEKETDSHQVEVVVNFDDEREMVYQQKDLDQIALAYCTSIHKAQGSEYDLVILPLVDLYSRLLRKDLLYTAITRAQKSLVMIGNPQSFYKAVSQVNTSRYTLLKANLLECFANFPQERDMDRPEVGQQQLEVSLSDRINSHSKTLEPSSNDNSLTEGADQIEEKEIGIGPNSTVASILSTKNEVKKSQELETLLTQDRPSASYNTGSDTDGITSLNVMASKTVDQSRSQETIEPDKFLLTLKNYLMIDPMIGMEGILPDYHSPK